MSDLIEKYNDYMWDSLVIGYARIYAHIEIDRDVCGVCLGYIDIECEFMGYRENVVTPKSIVTLISHATYPARFKDRCEEDNEYLYIMLNMKRVAAMQADTSRIRIFDGVSDGDLLVGMGLCVAGDYHLGYHEDIDVIYIRYLNIIIDLCAKWMNIRCQYMAQLIELYEYYYFQIYTVEPVKIRIRNKLLPKGFHEQAVNDEWEKLQFGIKIDIDHRGLKDELGNEWVRYRDFFIIQSKWTNQEAMKMSKLLQTIIIKYQLNVTELMDELDRTLEIVKAKYKMICLRVSRSIDKWSIHNGHLWKRNNTA